MTIQTHTWQHCTNGHNPTAGKHHKSSGLIGALDDFSFELRQEFRERLMEFRSLIAAVGSKIRGRWKIAEDCPTAGGNVSRSSRVFMTNGNPQRREHALEWIAAGLVASLYAQASRSTASASMLGA